MYKDDIQQEISTFVALFRRHEAGEVSETEFEAACDHLDELDLRDAAFFALLADEMHRKIAAATEEAS